MEATDRKVTERLRGMLRGSIEECLEAQVRAQRERDFFKLERSQGHVEAYMVVLGLLDGMEGVKK